MSDTPKPPTPPIARALTASEGEAPFFGDLFERRPLADQLTDWIARLPDGAAIAIDAAWGDGKTWFGRNWHALLRSQGYRTIYIDAFESDYIEDPFLLLAAEFKALAEATGNGGARSITKSAVALGRVLAPALAKAALRGVSRAVVGDKGVDGVTEALESAGDAAADKVEKALEDRLSEIVKRKATVGAFKESLTSLSSAGTTPIVAFIDELDRCSPDFAIRLLERAKHFFEVPGVVFVLLLNRAQLEAAIRGVYGERIDANLYLHKFLTLTLTLPKRKDLQWESRSFALVYLKQLGSQLGLGGIGGFEEFSKTLAGFAQLLDMSYRDMERAVAYYGLTKSGPTSAPIIAYLVALRVARPDIFRGIALGAAAGHQAAMEFVTDLQAHGKDVWILPLLTAAHEYVASGNAPSQNGTRVKNLQEFNQQFCRGAIGGPEDVFRLWASRLDLEVR